MDSYLIEIFGVIFTIVFAIFFRPIRDWIYSDKPEYCYFKNGISDPLKLKPILVEKRFGKTKHINCTMFGKGELTKHEDKYFLTCHFCDEKNFFICPFSTEKITKKNLKKYGG